MSDEEIGLFFDSVLVWGTNLLIVAAALWLVLSVFDYFRRRALNLTEAETVRASDVKPGFLSVDQEKRNAALAGGKQFDENVAQQAKAETPVAKACGWARTAAIIFAGLSLVTGVIGALLRVRFYDQVVKDYGTWESAQAIVSKYPMGFAIALVVIAISVFSFIRTTQENN